MPRSELALRLLSLAMALALLIVVHGERRVTIAMSVPFEARLPAGLEPVTPLPLSLRVALSGPWARLRNLDPGDLGPAIVDLSRTAPGAASWSVRAESIHLPPGVQVESIHPAQGMVDLRRDR
ncbi:MAG TPA: hypothetical protein VLV17_02365 [Anaeromyxobacteraceae bacterium]|nr:hypothetical protein [Anaeromyxobacteraceae bacterium]